MHSVAVLMSTYNGERFLREQMDSILVQEGVAVTLFVRDDGSTDRTVEMVRTFAEKNPNIVFVQGKNVGVGNSFMQLVYGAGETFDYYAFSDQDDIWLSQKMARAIERIGSEKAPALYCSNQALVDKNGNTLGLRHARPVDTGYLQILCNNQASGCTMLWNRSLQRLLIDPDRRPSAALLCKRIHDVWVGMVASVAGRFVYDETAYILYRQHENNVVGVRKANVFREWKKKLRNKALRNGRSALATEIVSKFDDVITSERTRETLRLCATYAGSARKKLALFRNGAIRRYSQESPWMYGVKILLDLF